MSPLPHNNTSATQGPRYIDGPSTRGTMDIVWGCMSVLLLCTWSVLHPNVPSQIQVRTKKEYWLRLGRRFWSKLVWATWNLLAPEWTFGKALTDLRSVKELKELEQLALMDDVPWSDSHTHFANMGGFGIKFEENNNHIDLVTETHDPVFAEWENKIVERFKMPGIPLLRSFADIYLERQTKRRLDVRIDNQNKQLVEHAIANINGRWLSEDWQKRRCYDPDKILPNIAWLRADTWVLDGHQLLVARRLGIIKRLPHISSDELNDRDKGDAFIKLLVVGQIFWFISQLLARFSAGLATSQLEVMTFAFSVSSAASYCLLFGKPKDIQNTIFLQADTRPTSPAEIVQLALPGPTYVLTSCLRSTPWIPNCALSPLNQGIEEEGLLMLGASVILTIFGAIHCISWNYEFPSELEHTLWQVSSIVTALALPMLWTAMRIHRLVPEDSAWYWVAQTVLGGSMWIFSSLFIGARGFILVEVFRSLAFLPADAFMVTPFNNLPHFS